MKVRWDGTWWKQAPTNVTSLPSPRNLPTHRMVEGIVHPQVENMILLDNDFAQLR